MFLNFLRTPATAIRVNVLVDAFVTSFLAASVGYLTVQSGINSEDALHAVSIGIVIGTVFSLPLARIGDVVGETTALTIVQILQVLAYVVLGVVPESIWLLGALIGVFMLGRFVSPLRGALPPRFLRKEELIGFKVSLRTATLTVVLFGAAAVPCVLYLDISIRAAASWIGVLGYLACSLSTQELHKRRTTWVERRKSIGFRISLGTEVWTSWFKVVVTCAVIATGSTLIPYILAAKGSEFSWLLPLSLLIEIAINYAIQKNPRFSKGQSPSTLMLLISASTLGVCGGALLIGSTFLELSTIALSIILIGVFCLNHTAQTLATIMAWQLQYEKGDDKDRSYIVAIFSMASSLGVGLANFIGASIYGGLSL